MSISSESPSPFGKIVAIAIRTEKNGPMRELERATGVQNQGLAEDLPCSTERGLSLLSQHQWETVQTEMGKQLPWHTRRANVLVDAGTLEPLLGKRLRIGQLEMEVLDETTPCGLMDKIEPGLRKTLSPEFRGGVLGRICVGGEIKVGDQIEVIGDASE